MSGMSPSTPANVPRWQDIPGIEYEPITQRRTSRTYPYQCRRCGAPATWQETFKSRDRRGGMLIGRRLCDSCYAGRSP